MPTHRIPSSSLEAFDIEVLWHHALSATSVTQLATLNRRILSGDQPLDILCVEGSVINGPDGTGRFDMLPEGPRKDILYDLAQRAQVGLAVGACASFGGIGADSETMAGGLQFNKWEIGDSSARHFDPPGDTR